MKHFEPFFPTQPKAVIDFNESGVAVGYENEIFGGVSKLEMFSLQIFCAMLANPSLRTATVDTLREVSIRTAEKLIEDVNKRVIDLSESTKTSC